MDLHATAEVSKLKKEKAEMATKLKGLEDKLKSMELELKGAKDQAKDANANVEARVEIGAAAAAGKARERIAREVAEAYKEGMAAARNLMKDMRSMF